MKQTITSAATSLNQIPGLYRRVPKALRDPDYWASVKEVLDYGGGRYNAFSDELATLGVRSFVYDPFNRSDEHNQLVERLLRVRGADVAVCANVLNVIREPEIRLEVLERIRLLTQHDAPVFITVWQGDGSSKGRATSKGWQQNLPLKSYLPEVLEVFPSAEVRGGVLVARLHVAKVTRRALGVNPQGHGYPL